MAWQSMANAPQNETLVRLRGGTTNETDLPAELRQREVVALWVGDGSGGGGWFFSHSEGRWSGEYRNPTEWQTVEA